MTATLVPPSADPRVLLLADQQFSVRPDAPDRPPHWRWLRASRLVDDNRPPDRRRDDQAVSDLMKFIRRLRRVSCLSQMDELADRHPTLFAAYRTAHHPHPPHMRAQLEARLLAKDYQPAVTAARTGLTVDQIEAYASAFFDVRGRLDNVAWVVGCVIGPEVLKGFNPKSGANVDLLLRLAGWVYGGMTVDVVSGRPYEGRPVVTTDEWDDLLDRANGTEARLKSYLAARNMGADSHTAPILFQHAAELRKRTDDREKNRQANATGVDEDTALKAIVGGLSVVQTTVARALAAGGPVAKTLSAAVEPRAADLVLIANGGTPTVRDVRFPEASTDGQ